ncbi:MULTISPECIES: ABC transporter permease subunit [Ramlibacter]|uniref:ABC transporter permease subunit n=1 Tax=Ramlibacter pinisoli TaxID=2682844 RepID=A0A6N8IQR5_9BURK|nr:MULTISPECIES: ABC transporter permease subunit [Ramlibacter]MBA2963519.1 ABC transporter permease subunit [Ramlibacter sp. CGMCC 1.13660]MVQ28486.1 ABC transporter permease subunit [Ramlibacter pinisoli]
MTTLARVTVLRLAVVPVLLLLLLFFYYPLVRIAGLSVHFPAFTLAEFTAALNPVNSAIALRTFVIAASVTGLCLLIGYPTAAFLSQLRGTAKKVVIFCVVMPFLTSLLVRSYAWVVLLGDEGAINRALMALHLIDRPLELLYSRAGMMIGMVHVMLPIMILPVYSSMQAMDPMLWRAAQGLGSGRIRAFLTVYFPQTLSGVRGGCILVFIISLGFYITPAMLGHSSDLMLGNLVANNVESSLNFGFASALALVLLGGTLLIFLALGGVSLRAKGAKQADDADVPARGSARSLSRLLPSQLADLTPAVALSGLRWRRQREREQASGGLNGRHLLFAFGTLACIYLVLPSVIVVIASFNGRDTLAFPPTEWSLRWYEFLLRDADWRHAGLASLKIAGTSGLLTVLLGTAAAYGIARLSPRNEGRLFYGLALAPMVVPTVVTALGAFKVLSDLGLYGTLSGVVAMHICLSIPLVVVVMVAAFSTFDYRLEMASQSLGASRSMTFKRVMMPLLLPSLLTATLLAFLHSFDELIITGLIAGTKVVTIPIKMWENIRNQVDPVIAAVSTLLILLPFLMLLLQRTPKGAHAVSPPLHA